MELKENNKIILLGLILLIVAGVVVVVLKGFNLPVEYQKHETINFRIGNNIDLEKVDNICKEVFPDKKYELKELELFNDSVSVSTLSFSDEEKQNLVSKINEAFGTNFVVPEEKEETDSSAETDNTVVGETTETGTTETAAESTEQATSEEETVEKKEINVLKVPNYRLRDMIKAYINPTAIIGCVVLVYILIRYMKIDPLRKVIGLAVLLALSELAILSIFAIVRLPISPVVINCLAGFALLETVFYMGTLEDKLRDENSK